MLKPQSTGPVEMRRELNGPLTVKKVFEYLMRKSLDSVYEIWR